MAQLDRLHPELSFTGTIASSGAERTGTPETPANGGSAPDRDLIGKLERLRALREDGTLTDDEFAELKARLLG
jgi:hypothetical protein